MSIYATTFSIDADDHAEDCKRVRNVGGILHISNKRQCTCKAGPFAYQGSHVLPSDDDPRGGYFDLGAIPGFIEREDRPRLSDDEDWPYWPWLRVAVNSEVVVLPRDQVVKLREAIDFWLDNTSTEDSA